MKALTLDGLDPFTLGYIDCALWSSTDESTPSGGEPMDRNYSRNDLTPEALGRMAADCAAFQKDNEALLAQAGRASQNGHDFWLTRNGHGAGFWDRGYPDEVGDALTDAAKSWGSQTLWVTTDGKIDL